MWSTIPSVNPDGDKQVTSDDDDETAPIVTTTTTTTTATNNTPNAAKQKVPCKWGKACYQTNAPHLQSYSQPEKEKPTTKEEKSTPKEKKSTKDEKITTKEDEKSTTKEDEKSTKEDEKPIEAKKNDAQLPPCKFGLKCFNSAAIHRKQFSHPNPDDKKVQQEEAENDKEEKPVSDEETTEVLSIRKSDYDKLLLRMKQLEDKQSNLEKSTAIEETNNNEPPTKKQKTTEAKENLKKSTEKVTPSLPPCPHGEKCYRSNPQHLAEYSHSTKN